MSFVPVKRLPWMATRDLWRFVAERFAPAATVPLVLVLALGLPSPRHLLALKVVTLFVALLGLRMADDLADLERDRCFSPGRCLPAGRVSAVALRGWMWVSGAVVLLLNLGNPALPLVAAGVSGYFLFFLFRKRISLFLKPLLSNLVFAFLPLYGALMSTGRVSSEALGLGLFLWLSAVGHEFAHSVTGKGEAHAGYPQYGDFLSPRSQAFWGAFCYFLGICALASMLVRDGRSAAPVGAWALVAGTLCGRLISRPEALRARTLYVWGFLFVLVPLGIQCVR